MEYWLGVIYSIKIRKHRLFRTWTLATTVPGRVRRERKQIAQMVPSVSSVWASSLSLALVLRSASLVTTRGDLFLLASRSVCSSMYCVVSSSIPAKTPTSSAEWNTYKSRINDRPLDKPPRLYGSWLINTAGIALGFRLQTQWLHCSMQTFSQCTESDLDSNPNCPLQE